MGSERVAKTYRKLHGIYTEAVRGLVENCLGEGENIATNGEEQCYFCVRWLCTLKPNEVSERPRSKGE